MTPQGKKVVGIIAEYNPFHNGHAYHMAEARRRSGCDYLIVVMSGDYVQRGAPALLDKQTRARFALEAGADAVLELPVALACGSAEFFARGAVGLLHRLGIVDMLCFGCEDTDLSALWQLAELLADEPAAYREALARLLRMGKGYPAARQEALSGLVPPETAALLNSPNNLLAVEYLKALSWFGSSIKPLPIRRIGDGYHEEQLSDSTSFLSACFPSATALRKQILKQPPVPIKGLKPFVPEFVYRHMAGNRSLTGKHLPFSPVPFCPVQEDDFSAVLFYALWQYGVSSSARHLPSLQKEDRRETASVRKTASLTAIQDISPDLADRITACLHGCFTFSALVERLSSRNYTAARVRRALLHMLLGITAEEMELLKRLSFAPYARLLGIKKESGVLFRSVSDEHRIPVITKIADAGRLLPPDALSVLQQDIAASELYHQVVFCRYGAEIPSDYYYPFLVIS